MPRGTVACRSSQTLALGRHPSPAFVASSNASCRVASRQELLRSSRRSSRRCVQVARPPSLSPRPSRPAYFVPIRHQPSRVAQALLSFWVSNERDNHARLQGQVVVGAPRRGAAPGSQRHEALCRSAVLPPLERIEPCVGLAVGVRLPPMQQACAQVHSQSVLVQRRSRPRANPSFERTCPGVPGPAAQVKR